MRIWAFIFVVAATAPAVRADDAPAPTPPWRVWTVAETRRVLRESPAPADAPSAAVAVSAAQNEWESFHVLMRTEEPISGVSIEPADLVGPNGAILPADSARLYRQHQLEIAEPSYRNPDFTSGWRPDPLVPFRHPLTNQPLAAADADPPACFTAVPFDLPAGQCHGFLVDLYVPPGAAPGVYRGTYHVTARGAAHVAVPVEMTVWAFQLPAAPTLKTAFGSPADRMRAYYRRLKTDSGVMGRSSIGSGRMAGLGRP